MIIYVVPICCHSNNDLITDALLSICNSFEKLNTNSTILKIATDGDKNCRKALNMFKT